tara:strand:- start:177190 stop:178608 length:1419 start_codon:yes stop_codon:yes gene_type:complete
MSIKKLGQQSLIYGTGNLAAKGVTFMLLPLYTNVFSPEDYGIVSLVFTFLGFMNVVLHYGLDASLLKHYVPANSKNRISILTNAYISFILSTLLVVTILILFRSQVANILFGSNLWQISILAGGILFFDVLWSIHTLILRAEGKPVSYTLISFFNVFSSLGLNLLLVLNLQMGVLGVVLSNFITSGIIFIITLPILIKRISISTLSFEYWKKLMNFGLPFFPAGIFSMTLELSDRYILRYLTDLDTVGLYNAGYKLGMLMMLVVMGFNMAWQPYFLKKEKSEREYIAKITTLILAILGMLWIILVVWVEDLVRIQFGSFSFIGSQYWPSTQIVPIVALAYIFHAAYLLQIPGVFLLEKSSWIVWVRGVGAITNILLNFLLIPSLGIVGASTATCLSFIFMAAFIFTVNRKIFPIEYEWEKIFIITIVAVSIWIGVSQFSLNYFSKIGYTTLYPLILFSTGILRINQLKRIVT